MGCWLLRFFGGLGCFVGCGWFGLLLWFRDFVVWFVVGLRCCYIWYDCFWVACFWLEFCEEWGLPASCVLLHCLAAVYNLRAGFGFL